MTHMGDVVGLLKKERDRLTNQLRGISAALEAFGAAYGKQDGVRSKISAAGRSRIAEAQRQRWEKLKAKDGQTKSAAASRKRKRTMSAATRKKIAAAQRQRWAKVKASQKKAA